jgi:hypothetical protein
MGHPHLFFPGKLETQAKVVGVPFVFPGKLETQAKVVGVPFVFFFSRKYDLLSLSALGDHCG